MPIVYDGITFDEGLRPDVLVEGRAICELKAVEAMHPVSAAQLLTELERTRKRLGLLINFNVPLIPGLSARTGKRGIKRVVL